MSLVGDDISRESLKTTPYDETYDNHFVDPTEAAARASSPTNGSGGGHVYPGDLGITTSTPNGSENLNSFYFYEVSKILRGSS